MYKYQDLQVWEKSMDLTTGIYKLTGKLIQKEQFGLVSKINRCAVSIASNIAEGGGRNTSGEFNQFFSIASGSLFELETQLLISVRVGYFKISETISAIYLIKEIHKMLIGLKKKL
ncbi:MAG: four helix bundle protein [Bacteroidota bacterium]